MRARTTLLWLTTVLSVITYLDRVAISSAATSIRADLGLSAVQMGWVFSAFTFAYAIFEIPSGWMGDVFGPRKVITRIVLWWSGFTMATGLTWNFGSLVTTRFLFGAGEAGAFPNISRSFARWFPAPERGAAHGMVFMGTRLGGALAPPLIVLLIRAAGWRESFFVFGALGVVWCVFWRRWFTDEPADHPTISVEELAHIQRGVEAADHARFDWRQLLSINLAMICATYFCMGYTLYFNLTWLPTYLQQVRGFTLQQSGTIAGAVLFSGAVCSWIGGKLTDVLVRRYGLKIGRSIGVVTLPISGLLIVAAALTANASAAAVLLAAAFGVGDLCLSAVWSMCHDVGGKRAGVVTGAMNTFGNLGGAISPLVVGYAVGGWNSWTVPFYVTASIYTLGGVFTVLVNPREPLLLPRAT